MSEYDKLVERCARELCKVNSRDPDAPRWIQYPGGYTSGICWHENIGGARAVLAEVLRTLKKEANELAIVCWLDTTSLAPPKDMP